MYDRNGVAYAKLIYVMRPTASRKFVNRGFQYKHSMSSICEMYCDFCLLVSKMTCTLLTLALTFYVAGANVVEEYQVLTIPKDKKVK